MRKSLILASLLASATAVNAEIYIDGGVNWTLFTPKHQTLPNSVSLHNPSINVSAFKDLFDKKQLIKKRDCIQNRTLFTLAPIMEG